MKKIKMMVMISIASLVLGGCLVNKFKISPKGDFNHSEDTMVIRGFGEYMNL